MEFTRSWLTQLANDSSLTEFDKALSEHPSLVTDFVQITSHYSTSLLIFTVRAAKPDKLALLIEQGADLNSQPQNPLFEFIDAGYLKLRYRDSAEDDASVNISDFESVLQLILESGVRFPYDDVAACEQLINKLEHILSDDNLPVMRLLVSYGFDPVAVEKSTGLSLLSRCLKPVSKWSRKEHKSEIFEYLIEQGCDINIGSTYSGRPLLSALILEYYSYAKRLIDMGAKLPWQGDEQLAGIVDYCKDSTPLELLEYLTSGLDFNHEDKNRGMPLQSAIERGKKNISDFLATHGASINGRQSDGTTPLLAAINADAKELIPRLIELGADLNIMDANGNSPLDLVLSRSGYKRVSDSFKRAGAKTSVELAGGNADEQLLSELQRSFQEGEIWSETALCTVVALPREKMEAWLELARHCIENNSAKPTSRWMKLAVSMMTAIGETEYRKAVEAWLPLIRERRTKAIPEEIMQNEGGLYSYFGDYAITGNNTRLLKGLLWLCVHFADSEMSRLLREVAALMYKKIPYVGMRNAKVANAAMNALANMPGTVGLKEIVILRSATKYNPALVNINRIFEQVAKDRDMSVDDLAALVVPDYGLNDIGSYTVQIGDFTAQLSLTSVGKTQLLWDKQGKLQKSVPAAIKSDYADEIRSLNSLAKDIQVASRAHCLRIEQMYIRNQRVSGDEWMSNYIDHPLIGYLARRLIWRVTADGFSEDVFFNNDGGFVDCKQSPVILPQKSEVQLWHPSMASADQIASWRHWIIESEITQPFKQAYREVYHLTEAELETRDQSNRYANHILRHGQFHALALQRGWDQKIGGSWDGGQDNQAYKEARAYNTVVRFEAEGLDRYGFTDSGMYACVITSELSFFSDARMLPLEEVDPLLFSEVMRDVDLFVGVSSIGNDPEWQATEGERDRAYRENVAFGELAAIAETRKDVLQALIPKLKIASKLRIDGRFLVVTGDLRTYKIHLGSSNILMQPNDAYLCIVPGASRRKSDLMLPFEGDEMLSIILSKALLLANDKKIKDTTILSQIEK